jgi:hypothetical protein
MLLHACILYDFDYKSEKMGALNIYVDYAGGKVEDLVDSASRLLRLEVIFRISGSVMGSPNYTSKI